MQNVMGGFLQRMETNRLNKIKEKLKKYNKLDLLYYIFIIILIIIMIRSLLFGDEGHNVLLVIAILGIDIINRIKNHS